jgi:hypothetical protein
MRGDFMRGKTPHRGTYFQPICYLDFWGRLDLSLSSHNSSKKKVGLRFMKLVAGGTHLNRD